MELTVEVVGEQTREVELDDGATYGDVVRAVGYSTQEATVLVDGTPVPEDASVDAERVTVLRLIKGGRSPHLRPEVRRDDLADDDDPEDRDQDHQDAVPVEEVDLRD